MWTPNDKEIRSEALKLLAGKKQYRWAGAYQPEILAMAQKIKARKARRGQDKFKNLYRPHNSKPDRRGSCSYCYPEVVSIHYTTGRVDRRRLDNPKYQIAVFDDWRKEWEELNDPCMDDTCWDHPEHYFSTEEAFDYMDDPEAHEICVIKALMGTYDCYCLGKKD